MKKLSIEVEVLQRVLEGVVEGQTDEENLVEFPVEVLGIILKKLTMPFAVVFMPKIGSGDGVSALSTGGYDTKEECMEKITQLVMHGYCVRALLKDGIQQRDPKIDVKVRL